MLITKQMKIIAHQVPVEYYLDNRYLTDYNGFRYMQRKDLKKLIENGTQTLSVVKEQYR